MKRASAARKLSPPQLARLLGRSRSHPYQVFSGKTGLRLATIVEWAQVLDVDIGLLACVYARPAGAGSISIPDGRPLEEPLRTPDVYPGVFGATLRQLRLLRRIRQSELADLAGIERRHLRRTEAGRVRAPEVETVYRLVAAMAHSDRSGPRSARADPELELMAMLARAYAGQLLL